MSLGGLALAVLSSLTWGAPPPLRLELPLSGWSGAASTQVVVSHAAPLEPLWLHWLGWDWLLWVNTAGRAGAFLPLLPQRNLVEVEQAGRGRAGAEVWGAAPSVDLAIVAQWDPGARLDLRITDPEGEVADSSNRRTSSGGVRLRDDPESPGPHAFVQVHGRAGEYRVAIVCGRLPAGRSVRVRALAILQPATAAEERRELQGLVIRCSELTELGGVELLGRTP